MTQAAERTILDQTGTAPRVTFPDTIAFRGFFAPVRIEADVYDLEVEGTIPTDLDGAFYRAAADTQYPPSNENDIYINGDGMITMVSIRNGHADLRTRFVRTQRFERERNARRSLFGAYRNSFTDDPSVAGIDDGNANTSVVWHHGKLLALKEAARPYELDPITLETKGIWDFDGQLTSRTFTAHPKIDPLTGQLIAFAYNSSGRPDNDVVLYEISPSGQITREERFEAPYSSMMHDWLVTRDHLIFTFSPMISDFERMKDEPQYFMWDPPKGTHVAIIPRHEGVAGIRWFSSSLVMETHSLNAYSTGDIITADHFIADSGWFSQFPKTTVGPLREAPPIAQRWTLSMRQGSDSWTNETSTYTSQLLFDHPGDMPRVDPRVLMSRNRHSWIGSLDLGLGSMPDFGPMGPPFNCLVHLDDETGKRTRYYPGPDSAPEEPVFVAKGGDSGEGEGYLISVVSRRRLNRNDIVILDALDLGAGPLATLKVPFRLRYAFHGTWVPGSELARVSDASTAQAVFDHAGVSVADLDRSHAFYADVLGFTTVEDEFEFAEHQLRGRVLVNATGVRVELFCREGSRPTGPHHQIESTRTQGWFQLALRVPDIEATFAAVVAAGAVPSLAPTTAPDGFSRVAFVHDPDGNLVEFLQRPAS